MNENEAFAPAGVTLNPVPNFGTLAPSALARQSAGGNEEAVKRMAEATWETNWIGAAVMAHGDQNFPVDPSFDPAPLIDKKFDKHSPYLLGASSQAQFDFRKMLLERQMQNQDILAESPVLGLGASAVGAAFDPTTYIGLGWAMRGGSLARVMARSAAQGTGSTALQALLANAYNPTGSAVDVAEWALMGGGGGLVLGGAVLTGESGRRILVNQKDGARNFIGLTMERPGVDYSPAAAKDAQRIILTDQKGFTLAEGLSADVNPRAPTGNMEGAVPTGISVERLGLSPMVRGINSGIEKVSAFMQDLAPIPFFLNKHAEGIANPVSAQTAATLKYTTHSADLVRATDRLYHDYRGNAGKEGFVAGAIQWASDLKGRDGALSPTEFRNRITDQAFSGKFDDAIPQVNEAAKAHAAFYDRMLKEAVDAELLPAHLLDSKRSWKLLDGVLEERYGGSMIWDLERLRANPAKFEEAWMRWQQRVLDGDPHKSMTAADAYKAVTKDRRYTPIDEDMTGMSSALRERGLKVPYSHFKEFLRNDAEAMQRFYARTVGLDIELARRSRVVTGMDKDGKPTFSAPDISMRAKIDAAKSDFMAELDNAFEGKGAPVKMKDDRAQGPALAAFDKMTATQKANRTAAGNNYAAIMEVISGNAKAADLGAEARSIYMKVAKAADPEASLIAEIRKTYDANDAAAVSGARSEIEAAAKKHGLSTSEAAKVFDRMQAAERDMLDARDAIRGTLGQPDDPMAMTPRVARVAKQLTNTTVLTGLLSQIPDLGGMVMRYGFRDTFGAVFDDLGRAMRGDLPKMAKSELEKAGVTLEMVMQARAAMMTDLTDMHGRFTPLERVVDDMNSLQFTMSLTTGWTDIAQRWTGMLAINEILDTADRVARGVKLSNRETQAMARSGLDQDTLSRIASMPGHEKNGKVWLTDTAKWTDAGLIEKFRGAVLDDVDRVIVKSNRIEQPNWISTPLGSLVGQYKGFAISVTNRVLIPALQQKDMKTMIGVASLVGAGFVVDQIRAYQTGMHDRPMSVQLGRAIERSGVGGWLVDAGRAMDTVTDSRFGYGALIGDTRKESMIGLLGPAASQAEKAVHVLQGTVGTWTAKNAAEARGITPFNKMAHMDWMFDSIQKASTPETLGSRAR